MKRAGATLIVAMLLLLPLGGAYSQQDQHDNREYKIQTMAENDSWVRVEKRQRIGAGSTTYYLRKDRIISIVLEYPNTVHIKLEEQVEYRLDFVGYPAADGFVKELVSNL